MGQYRHLRLDGLPDGNQGKLPLQRLHPSSPYRTRPGVVQRSGPACRYVWYPDLVVFLLQESDARLRTSART